jgi:hypothetical protein
VKRKPHDGGISAQKFAEIEPLLRSVRRTTKPSRIDLYEVFCVVLYRLRTGFHKNQVSAARESLGRNACSAFWVIDAHSVKNTDTVGLKGYDAGE